MASVFMCKTSSANHTVVLYSIVCYPYKLYPTVYQSTLEKKECPGGPVVWGT